MKVNFNHEVIFYQTAIPDNWNFDIFTDPIANYCIFKEKIGNEGWVITFKRQTECLWLESF